MKKLSVFVLLSIILFAGCKTTKIEQQSQPESESQPQWHTLCNGIEITEVKKHSNFQYTIVKIDLSTPDLKINLLPAYEGWQKTQQVKTFAKKTNSVIAINTDHFQKKAVKAKINGICINNKKIIHEPNQRYCGIAFYKEETGFSAKIYDSQTEILEQENLPEYAAGGFWVNLEKQEIKQFKEFYRPRIAAAVSNNGKTLYLFAGKQLSYKQCAIIFRNLNVDKAMQFDGGKSGQLTVNGKNTLKKYCRPVPAALGISIN